MTDIPSPEEFMSVEECARVVRVEPAQFRRWVKDGKVPGVKIGKRWLIRTVDFRAWLDERGKPKPVALAGGRVHPGEPAAVPEGGSPRTSETRQASGRGGSLAPRVIG